MSRDDLRLARSVSEAVFRSAISAALFFTAALLSYAASRSAWESAAQFNRGSRGLSFVAEISVTHVAPAETRRSLYSGRQAQTPVWRPPVYWCGQSPQSKERQAITGVRPSGFQQLRSPGIPVRD